MYAMMKLPTEERKQVENEMLFRRVNERVIKELDDLDAKHMAEGNTKLIWDDELLLNFKCECSDETCEVRVPMKMSKYKEIHFDRSCFIIKPHHEVKPIEKVIEVAETYSVVRKNNVTPEPREGAKLRKTSIENKNL